jgi:hypothetical protein
MEEDPWGSFLSTFFGEGNDISLADLRGESEAAGLMVGWIDEGRFTRREASVLLRRRATNFDIYCLAYSDRQSREVYASIHAFIGSSYSALDGVGLVLDRGDRVEEAVWRITEGNGFRVRVANADDVVPVLFALDIARKVWQQRPDRIVHRRRPVGRILRDFELALQSGRVDTASELIEEAKKSRQLSAMNILFLKIRWLASQERWSELLAMAELTAVADISRPSRVTGDLLAAVFYTELVGSSPSEMKEKFHDQIRPRYPWLFRGWTGQGSGAALRCYALHLATADPPQLLRLEELLDAEGTEETDRKFLAEISITPAGPEPGLRELLLKGAYEDAYLSAADMAPNPESCDALIRCSIELARLDVVQSMLSHVGALEPELRGLIEGSRLFHEAVSLVDEIGRTTEESAVEISDWVAWASALNRGARVEPLQALALRGADEWSPDDYIRDPSLTSDLVSQLDSDRPPRTHEALRCSVPHLLRFFLSRTGPRREFVELYEALFVLIGSEAEVGLVDADALLDLAEASIEIGVTPDRYIQLVGDLLEFFQRIRSTNGFGWGLEVLDQLLDIPCPDDAARQRFASGLVGAAQRSDLRLTQLQVEVLEQLATLAGLPGVTQHFPRVTQKVGRGEGIDQLAAALSGKTVAIYTLTAGVAERASTYITRLAKDCQVWTSQDKVASERLVHFAKSADVFVVVTRSAKHAATDAIRANRGDAALLYARGKGTSSVLEALREWSELSVAV